MIRLDPREVEAARQGDRAALEFLIRAAEGPVYNLAIRMLAHPADAEDATQEILIKIVTHLGGLREVEAAGGWAMRIASRHLVEMRKQGRIEAMRMSFKGFAEDLERGLDGHAEASPEDDAETRLAIEEVKVGCTLAMLTCLTRQLRIAYLLGDVFELTDSEAASVLEISAPAYRQRLRRARATVKQFVLTVCGNANEAAACRCERRVTAAEAHGRITRGTSAFGLDRKHPKTITALRTHVRQLDEGRRAAGLMRSNPDFPSDLARLVLATMETGRSVPIERSGGH